MADEATRAVWRNSARARRAKARQGREAAKAIAAGETVQQFWTRTIGTAQPDHIAQLEERQSYVLDLCDDAELAMEGTHGEDGELWVESVREEVEGDIAEHGVVALELILLEFWRFPHLFARLMAKANEPTRQFLRYGLVTAIPAHRLHQWQTWLASRKPAAQQLFSNFGSLKCSTPGCTDLGTSVPASIVEAYAGKYLCSRCRTAEQPARQMVESRKEPANTLYDGFGRFKDTP